jgi:hypothetical protein
LLFILQSQRSPKNNRPRKKEKDKKRSKKHFVEKAVYFIGDAVEAVHLETPKIDRR